MSKSIKNQPTSYYDAMVAEILRRIDAAGMTRKEVAAGVGISTDTLRRKLNGQSMLMLEDIRRFAVVLECRMSDLTPTPNNDVTPAGTGGGVEPVRDIFKADAENSNLEWGPDFEAAGCVIATHRLVDSGKVGIQFCEEPETMTPAEARQVAAALLTAADYLDRG